MKKVCLRLSFTSMDIYTLVNLVGQKRWEDLIGWLLKGETM
ncbi:hypothetical protein [Desulfosporosinus sp.]|nr:hypothetical protein [Desulfosporosinus sp.]MDA8222025.1 hypothetical protein [Desulfitobacterium hafniense]